MAPIEPDLSNSNLLPLLVGGAYVALTGSAVGLVAHRVLYRSFKALPVSQATRGRENNREKHIYVFQGLAALSLSFALYYAVQLLSLSYSVWASERGEALPLDFWGDNGMFSQQEGLRLQLGRWFHDTDILSTTWEAALEKSRNQWWTQQLFLGGSAWSLYVAIEGRRRNIPHVWAFVVLSMLVSLSFAQNLFFLAVLLTPTPLSNADKRSDLVPSATKSKAKHVRKSSKSGQAAVAAAEHTATWLPHRIETFLDQYLPPKPVDWSPYSLLYIVPLVMTAVDTVLVALAANTTSFRTFLSHIPFDMLLPLVIIRLAPLSWGSRSRSSSSVNRVRALTAYSVFGVLSLLIYLLQSVIAVIDNDISPSHRYPILPFQHRDNRTRLTRAGSSVSRVLGSLADHPACGRIAWDVILSGVSLVVWAGVRGVEAGKMLRAAGWATKSELDLAADLKNYVVKEVEQLVNHVEDDEVPPSPTSKGAVSSRKKGGAAATKKITQHHEEDDADGAFAGADLAPAWMGDEEKDEDWESSALGWGMLVLGGLGVGSAAVLGADSTA